MNKPTKQPKKFRIVTKDRDEYQSYPTTRAAIIDALTSAVGVPTKLYRVLDDRSESLLFDSEKCNQKTVEGVLAWAEKGSRR